MASWQSFYWVHVIYNSVVCCHSHIFFYLLNARQILFWSIPRGRAQVCAKLLRNFLIDRNAHQTGGIPVVLSGERGNLHVWDWNLFHTSCDTKGSILPLVCLVLLILWLVLWLIAKLTKQDLPSRGSLNIYILPWLSPVVVWHDQH